LERAALRLPETLKGAHHMTTGNSDKAKRFHAAIKAALFTEWDPIGVNKMSGAEDEYDSYVPAIYKLLLDRHPRHELFDYLWSLETRHMGLTGNRQATEHFTDRLLQISQEMNE
jgi:hypothetical protein